MKTDINVMAYVDLLRNVTSIDWNLQPSNVPNQKRAMAEYSIIINCQPELMSLNKYEDFREGLYADKPLKQFYSNTPAMRACVNANAPNNQPFILVQKGSSIFPQPSYTIFICPAAKWLFKPQYNIDSYVQTSLLQVTCATLWQEYRKGTNWNLGPRFSVNNFMYLDSMILAALLAIAQGQESTIVYGYMTDAWTYCFKSGGANWADPSESYLNPITDVAGVVLY